MPILLRLDSLESKFNFDINCLIILFILISKLNKTPCNSNIYIISFFLSIIMAESLVIDNYKTDFVNSNRDASMLFISKTIINVKHLVACLSNWIPFQAKLIQNMGI